MLKVGLTGGLACGKTFVGEALVALGCHLLQADKVGHEVLAPGGEAYDPVIAEFGPSILDPDRRINRKRLAAFVFSAPDRLARLNALVHPAVFRREDEFLQKVAAADPRGIAVVEAAILIETGSYKRYDRLILVVCEVEEQIRRAIKRDQVTRDEVLARLSRQMPVAEKRKFADHVIDTSGPKDATLQQVRAVYEDLKRVES